MLHICFIPIIKTFIFGLLSNNNNFYCMYLYINTSIYLYNFSIISYLNVTIDDIDLIIYLFSYFIVYIYRFS